MINDMAVNFECNTAPKGYRLGYRRRRLGCTSISLGLPPDKAEITNVGVSISLALEPVFKYLRLAEYLQNPSKHFATSMALENNLDPSATFVARSADEKSRSVAVSAPIKTNDRSVSTSASPFYQPSPSINPKRTIQKSVTFPQSSSPSLQSNSFLSSSSSNIVLTEVHERSRPTSPSTDKSSDTEEPIPSPRSSPRFPVLSSIAATAAKLRKRSQTVITPMHKSEEDTNHSRPMSLGHVNPETKSLTVEDFELLKVIGKGAFGKVKKKYVITL
jgi:hypothetical protein